MAAEKDEAEAEFEDTLILINFGEFEDLSLLQSETQIELRQLDDSNPTCQITGLNNNKGEYCKLNFNGAHQYSLGSKIFFPVEYNVELDSSSSCGEDNCIHMVTKIVNFSLSQIENVTSNPEVESST
mmetsp:Transcript_30712/g.44056  ORF Transcript_30712/g.44056 Transcript_30712/m.44056 type:complete len:127 (-) Transcript_30712:146-526(-)